MEAACGLEGFPGLPFWRGAVNALGYDSVVNPTKVGKIGATPQMCEAISRLRALKI